MELIAASRIVKAQQRVNAAKPYSGQITRVISALASQSTIDHPLLRLDDARRRDELHRTGDLLRRLHRPDAAAVDAELGTHG